MRPLRARGTAPLFVVTGVLALATQASAEDDEGWGSEAAAEEEEAPAPKEAEAPQPGATEDTEDATDGETLDAPPDDAASEPDGARKPASRSLGLRYRGIILPKAVLNAFIDGGETVYVHGLGPELAIRNENVEYIFSAWLAFYGMGPVAIKGTSDAEEAWEIVESDMKSLYVTFDHLWHAPLAKGLELSYGGGVGLGFLFGDLKRAQANLPAGATAGDADAYVPCTAQGVPNSVYCDDINDHYGDYSEPNWFNGGAKPALFPWLTAQIGLRYQPHEKVVTRLDLGIGTSGLFFGVGADYAL